MLTHPLFPKLRALNLSGMALTLDNRSSQAAAGNLTPAEFLAILLDDELERRANVRLRRRLLASGIDERKTLANFDFLAVPQLNRSLVMELANCGFISRAENILVCGPTGTGKSHLMNALGFEALRRGHTVLVRTVHRLLAKLHAARADGSFVSRFAKLCAVDMLILDDFGLRPLTAQAAEDLYEIIRERYERNCIAVTANRAFHEWADAFGDGLLSNAALDRLTHYSHTLVIRGHSFRQRGRRKEDIIIDDTHDGNDPDDRPIESSDTANQAFEDSPHQFTRGHRNRNLRG